MWGFHHVTLHKEHSWYIGTVLQLLGTDPLFPFITVWGQNFGARQAFHNGNLKGICNFQLATSSKSTLSKGTLFSLSSLSFIFLCFGLKMNLLSQSGLVQFRKLTGTGQAPDKKVGKLKGDKNYAHTEPSLSIKISQPSHQPDLLMV